MIKAQRDVLNVVEIFDLKLRTLNNFNSINSLPFNKYKS